MIHNLKVIVDTISEQLQRDMIALRDEECHPSANADEMDDKIKNLKERVCKLRVLRQDAEAIFTGANVS